MNTNQIKNKFKYKLTDRLGTLDVFPIGENDFSIEWSRENDDSNYDYDKSLSGKITFVKEAYDRLMQMETSVYRCDEQKLEVIKDCNGTDIVIFSGRISLNDAEFNLDKCLIVLKFLQDNKNQCYEINKSTKFNLLQLIYNRKTARTSSFSGTIETKNCNFNSDTEINLFDWCGNGSYEDGNWAVVSANSNSPDGVHFFTNNVWKREILEIDCAVTPEVDWILLEDNCNTTGKKKYAKSVEKVNCESSFTPPDETGAFERNYSCQILGYDSETASIDNGILLEEALEKLIEGTCPNLQIKSDFFQINPENPTTTNYVTGKRSVVDKILIFQKSDVKRPNTSNNAWKLEVSFSEILEVLQKVFNVKWRIEGNIFRLEHVSWFSKNQGIDVTTEELKKYFAGKRIYTYASEKIPEKEVFKFKEQQGQDWNLEVIYSGCVSGKEKKENIVTIDKAMTDIVFAMNNPDSESNIVEDAGFVLVSTRQVGNEYFINSESGIEGGRRLNNVFAWRQLFRDYWHYERPMKSAKVNGIQTTFQTTIPTKKGEKFAIPYAVCSESFNPDDIIKTGLGNGIVDSGVLRLKDCFLELNLLYESNQELTPNEVPIFTGGGVYYTYKNVAKLIDIAVSDPDGTVNTIQVINPPNNGILEILSFSQIRYTPNANFEGIDNFSLRAVDNISEFSSLANFGIVVQPENSAPIATDDNFNVYQGEAFSQGLSILNNDSDDFNSLQLITTSATTTEGISITINSNGFFDYTPPVNFEGTDSFQYQIKDDLNNISTATVFLHVAYENRPKAIEDQYQTRKNQNFSADGSGIGKEKLTANDYTPDGLSYTYTTNPETKATQQGGSVTINSDGTFSYIPPTDFTGTDSFQYTVNNPNGSGIGTAKISVLPLIYVKMTNNDLTNQGHFGDDLYIKKQDYILNFYSDSSGNTPLSVDNLNFKVKIKEVFQTVVNGNQNTSTYIYFTDFLQGTSKKILDDFTFVYQDFVNGFDENTTVTIEADQSYEIIP